MKKKFVTVLMSLAMLLTMMLAMSFVSYAADATLVNSVSFTGFEMPKYLGSTTRTGKLTDEGSSGAYLNLDRSEWEYYSNGSWIKYCDCTALAKDGWYFLHQGKWRLHYQIKLEEPTSSVCLDGPLSVTVNGETWPATNSVYNAGDESYAWGYYEFDLDNKIKTVNFTGFDLPVYGETVDRGHPVDKQGDSSIYLNPGVWKRKNKDGTWSTYGGDTFREGIYTFHAEVSLASISFELKDKCDVFVDGVQWSSPDITYTSVNYTSSGWTSSPEYKITKTLTEVQFNGFDAPIEEESTSRGIMYDSGKSDAYIDTANGRWEKKDGDNWTAYSGETFEAGTYRFVAPLKITEEDSCFLLDPDYTLTVDGAEWTRTPGKLIVDGCTSTDEVVSQEFKAHHHDFVKKEGSSREPSCDDEGRDYYECTDSECHAAYSEIIPALGHEYGEDQICVRCGRYSPDYNLTSGNCGEQGDNVKWKYDADTKTLTLSGSGAMQNYEGEDHKERSPFWFFNDKAEKIVIEEGVTAVGDYAFYNYTSLKEVILPPTLNKIGVAAFAQCTKLRSIRIPKSVQLIHYEAFFWDNVLNNVYYCGSEADWNDIEIKAYNYNLTDIADKHFNSHEWGDEYSEVDETLVPSIVSANGRTKKNGHYDVAVKCKYCDAEDTKHHMIPAVSSWYFTNDKTSYSYTGKQIKPAVSIEITDDDYEIKNGTDYDLVYPSTCKYVGKQTVTINFKNHYKGTVSLNYTILPKKSAVKTIKPGKKRLTVSASTGAKATGGSAYQIAYKQKGTSSWKKVNTITASKTIKKLKKGKRYYIKMRAYKKVGGKVYYGAWSTAKLSAKVK